MSFPPMKSTKVLLALAVPPKSSRYVCTWAPRLTPPETVRARAADCVVGEHAVDLVGGSGALRIHVVRWSLLDPRLAVAEVKAADRVGCIRDHGIWRVGNRMRQCESITRIRQAVAEHDNVLRLAICEHWP